MVGEALEASFSPAFGTAADRSTGTVCALTAVLNMPRRNSETALGFIIIKCSLAFPQPMVQCPPEHAAFPPPEAE